MSQFHAALEVAGGEAHKGHAVAVLRIHIGLYLKHKSCDFGFFWCYMARLGFLGLWLRAKISNPLH